MLMINEVNLELIMDLNEVQESLAVEVKLEELIVLTAALLNDLIDQEGGPCESIFNSSTIPSISLEDFLRRLHKYTQFSAECLVIAIVYIDRYNMEMPEFSLNNLNVHKMVLTAVLLAAKFQDDFYYDNKAFEFAGGVNAMHLHELELEIFEKLDYNLYVSN